MDSEKNIQENNEAFIEIDVARIIKFCRGGMPKNIEKLLNSQNSASISRLYDRYHVENIRKLSNILSNLK